MYLVICGIYFYLHSVYKLIRDCIYHLFILFNSILTLYFRELFTNQLDHLPSDIFVTLTDLQQLDLHQNQIRNITSKAFAGLHNLKSL